jgi:hypothetical protein
VPPSNDYQAPVAPTYLTLPSRMCFVHIGRAFERMRASERTSDDRAPGAKKLRKSAAFVFRKGRSLAASGVGKRRASSSFGEVRAHR